MKTIKNLLTKLNGGTFLALATAFLWLGEQAIGAHCQGFIFESEIPKELLGEEN
ncbi:MAG: hypothetical protein FWF59_14380 [Turicibacter sp.]|nr:hypothetical protein [Turicibacter sp.]